MTVYRLCDLHIAYTPQSDYAAAFLAPFQAEATDADLSVSLSPSAWRDEADGLSVAHEGIAETTALLRRLSLQLLDFDRLLLHAATVVFNNAAYAFIAPSGTGKTTHARLWTTRFPKRAAILNGDRLFVHVQACGATAYGGPWRGKEGIGQHGHAPLKGIFILTRSETAHCEPLSPTDALPHLLRATPYPKSKSERLTVLSLLGTLAEHVPFYRLHAPLSTAAVDAAYAQLEESL